MRAESTEPDLPDTILILQAGDPVPTVRAAHGPFAGWIRRGVGDAWAGDWAEHDLRGEEPLPDPDRFAAIIVTGSASSVTERAAWMLRGEELLRVAASRERPIFGICFGHQMLGQALGGEVQKNPRGREIGTVELTIAEDDLLFAGLPRRLEVNATHVDSVTQLPPGATAIASTSLEPNAVVVFAPGVRGVQFHPEFSGEVMRGYVSSRHAILREEGLDADAILARAVDTPLSVALMRNFVTHFVRAARRAA